MGGTVTVVRTCQKRAHFLERGGDVFAVINTAIDPACQVGGLQNDGQAVLSYSLLHFVHRIDQAAFWHGNTALSSRPVELVLFDDSTKRRYVGNEQKEAGRYQVIAVLRNVFRACVVGIEENPWRHRGL